MHQNHKKLLTKEKNYTSVLYWLYCNISFPSEFWFVLVSKVCYVWTWVETPLLGAESNWLENWEQPVALWESPDHNHPHRRFLRASTNQDLQVQKFWELVCSGAIVNVSSLYPVRISHFSPCLPPHVHSLCTQRIHLPFPSPFWYAKYYSPQPASQLSSGIPRVAICLTLR